MCKYSSFYRQVAIRFSLLILSSLLGAIVGRGAPPADSLITLASSDLPIIVIDTHGQTIPDEPKIDASMGVIDHGPGQRNLATDPFNGYDGRIGIEIRGSSSQMFPKKQYAVETRDSTGNELKVSLLGLPDESDWVLYAVHNDKSLLRDVLIFTIARSIGRYASRARYCEVILNGEYVGVYILLEKVARGKNRVNITKLSSADTLGDAITGGYIVKIDKTEGSETAGWYSGFPPRPGAGQRIYYQYHYPKAENLVGAQIAYITQYIRDFELAMYLPSYADSATGYPRLLDVDAFVDFVLLNEIGKNVDAYRLSCYMYKDRDSKGGRLVMGPLWDFTLAFGNCDYYDASLVEGFQWTYLTSNLAFLQTDSYQVPFWWKKLLEDPTISEKLQQRWNALRGNQLSLQRITTVIDSLATLVNESQQRNFLRWSILGKYLWPNYFVGNTYTEEINYLKNWVSGRLAWLDQAFNAVSVDDSRGLARIPERFVLFQNYPNPFNPTTVIGYSVPPQERRDLTSGSHLAVPSDVRLVVYDLLGREVAVLVDEQKPPGRYEARFSASAGDGAGLSSGVYFCRLQAGGFVATMKMMLVR